MCEVIDVHPDLDHPGPTKVVQGQHASTECADQPILGLDGESFGKTCCHLSCPGEHGVVAG